MSNRWDFPAPVCARAGHDGPGMRPRAALVFPTRDDDWLPRGLRGRASTPGAGRRARDGARALSCWLASQGLQRARIPRSPPRQVPAIPRSCAEAASSSCGRATSGAPTSALDVAGGRSNMDLREHRGSYIPLNTTVRAARLPVHLVRAWTHVLRHWHAAPPKVLAGPEPLITYARGISPRRVEPVARAASMGQPARPLEDGRVVEHQERALVHRLSPGPGWIDLDGFEDGTEPDARARRGRLAAPGLYLVGRESLRVQLPYGRGVGRGAPRRHIAGAGVRPARADDDGGACPCHVDEVTLARRPRASIAPDDGPTSPSGARARRGIVLLAVAAGPFVWPSNCHPRQDARTAGWQPGCRRRRSSRRSGPRASPFTWTRRSIKTIRSTTPGGTMADEADTGGLPHPHASLTTMRHGR